MNSEDRPIVIGLSIFVSALVALGALMVAGCHGIDGEHFDALVGRYVEDPAHGAQEQCVSTPEARTEIAQEAASAAFEWCYGGFNGSRAAEEPNAQIGGLSISDKGMSYKWVKGGCEVFGALDRGDAGHTLACVFYRDGEKWRGGKFDWISSSRTTRGWENIRAGYNGWNTDAFFAAREYAFCIASKDGKRRTNFVYCSR